MGNLGKLKKRLKEAEGFLKHGKVGKAREELQEAEGYADCRACRNLIHEFRGELGQIPCDSSYCPVDDVALKKMRGIREFAARSGPLHETYEELVEMKPDRRL